MFAQLNQLKVLNQKVQALLNRRVRLLEQVEQAVHDDAAAREKLLDMTIEPDVFTKYSLEARAAQRRRANLHDKVLDVEEAVEGYYEEMQGIIEALRESKEFPLELSTATPVVAAETAETTEELADEPVEETADEEIEETEEAA